MTGSWKREAVYWALFLVVLSPFILYAVPEMVGAEEALVVQSGSMEPAIQTGSVIWIYSVEPSNLGEGDIITFRSGTRPSGEPQLTTHRIVEVLGENEFRTKGDNNEDPDPRPVQGDRVVGKFGFEVPFLGYLVVWAGTSQAFVILVLVPAALMILNELATIVTELAGLEEMGSDMEMLKTAIVIVTALALVAAGVYLTELGARLFSGSGGYTLGPTAFGIVMIAAMVVSMVALRFMDL